MKNTQKNKGLIVTIVIIFIISIGVWGYLFFNVFNNNGKTIAKSTNKQKVNNVISEQSTNINKEYRDNEINENENVRNNIKFSNISSDTQYEMTEIIGEITNNNSKTYSFTFTVNLYDENGNLIATSPNAINKLAPGETRSFTSMFTADYSHAATCKIQINNIF